MENKIKEYEQVVQEYQLKLKEWEGSHGKKVGELESIIFYLRKTIYRQANKTKGTRLARIFETLKLKKKVEEKNFPVKKVVRVKVRVPKETMVRVRVRVRAEGKIHLEVQCP